LARKILLADDSVTAQNMGRKILTEAGYEVITVNNGPSALKKIAEGKPDLIILDVYMPGYGGLEVCQRVKDTAESSRIPILLSVGKLEPFKADDGRKAGADAHIVKPFEATELLSAINKLEDKIVPQGQGKRFSRAARNAAADDSELKDGWKDRLPTPISKGKKAGRDAGTAEDTEKQKEKASAATFAEIINSDKKKKPELQETHVPESQPVAASESQPTAKPHVQATDAPSPAEPVGQARPKDFSVFPAHDEVETTAVDQTVSFETSPVVTPETPEPTHASLAAHEVDAALASLGSHDNSHSVMASVFAATEMAVIAGPRWIAEEVALTDAEANCNLHQEMQNAVAQAPESASSEAAKNIQPPVETAQVEVSAPSSVEPSAIERHHELQASYESAPVDAAETLMCEADEPIMSELRPSELRMQDEVQPEAGAVATAEPVELKAELDAPAEREKAAIVDVVAQEVPLVAPAEVVAAASAESGATPAIAAVSQELATEPHAQYEAPIAGAQELAAYAAAASASGVSTQPASPAETMSAEPRELEAEPPTREAWANWQQIRDSVLGGQVAVDLSAAGLPIADAPSKETSPNETHPDPSASESSTAEASAPDANDADAIASIVDSVLADLKPKLMAEIAKKLGKRK
jgi:CheY-like chemotaxis protein